VRSTDAVGSLVEDPPLLVVSWLVVLNAHSVLVAANVLVPHQCFASWHLRFDLELLLLCHWEGVVLHCLSVDSPGLV